MYRFYISRNNLSCDDRCRYRDPRTYIIFGVNFIPTNGSPIDSISIFIRSKYIPTNQFITIRSTTYCKKKNPKSILRK